MSRRLRQELSVAFQTDKPLAAYGPLAAAVRCPACGKKLVGVEEDARRVRYGCLVCGYQFEAARQ